MTDIAIVVVEDEPEVRQAIVRDLLPFRAAFRIEVAEDVDDARSAIEESVARGGRVALVLADHLMPGQRGTDFLIDLNNAPGGSAIRKVLITGQAGHEDTIRAINEADLDHYIAKPWDPKDLQAVVRDQLTEWVVAEVDDVLPYVAVLDGPRLLGEIKSNTWDR